MARVVMSFRESEALSISTGGDVTTAATERPAIFRICATAGHYPRVNGPEGHEVAVSPATSPYMPADVPYFMSVAAAGSISFRGVASGTLTATKVDFS